MSIWNYEEDEKPPKLSQTDIDLIQRIIDSNIYDPQDLAPEFHVARSTVKTRLCRIHGKLDVRTSRQAIIEATKWGLVTITHYSGRPCITTFAYDLRHEVARRIVLRSRTRQDRVSHHPYPTRKIESPQTTYPVPTFGSV